MTVVEEMIEMNAGNLDCHSDSDNNSDSDNPAANHTVKRPLSLLRCYYIITKLYTEA